MYVHMCVCHSVCVSRSWMQLRQMWSLRTRALENSRDHTLLLLACLHTMCTPKTSIRLLGSKWMRALVVSSRVCL